MPHTLKPKIRTIPHFPKQGIMFRDITTLIKDKEGFNHMIDLLVKRYSQQKPDIIVGIESRGFIIGSALAHRLNLGFVPVRKPNKLPAEKEFIDYKTEYSTDRVEIHKDAIQKGQKVLIVDDLIATAGTCLATANLVKRLGGDILECAFVIELPSLKGRERLEQQGYNVFSLVQFEGE